MEPRVWGIMLAKDEADIIGTNLRHHMALGLSGIVVFDNMSRDSTGDIARSVPGVVVIQDPEPAFRQGEKNLAMTEIAMGSGADWVLAVDADELWYPTRAESIPDALASVGVDAFRARMLDHVCSAFDDESEADPVLRMRWRRSRPGGAKAAHRCSAGACVWGGNESVRTGDGDILDPPVRGCMLIRHYSVRGLRHLKRKAANGWRAVSAPGVHRNACGHWRKWYMRWRSDPRAFEGYFSRKLVLDARRLRRRPLEWREDPFTPAHLRNRGGRA